MGKKSIVHLGSTGAVGTEVYIVLKEHEEVKKILLLGRRNKEDVSDLTEQKKVDIFDKGTYDGVMKGYDVAICTLGVGEPSKISKEKFIAIDKVAVIDFARACKKQGIKHFLLLSSVGSNKHSRSFFLRTKGELIDALQKLNFEKLSIFKPSMIITPNNRYGLSQWLTLKIRPKIDRIFRGSRKKYRGIKVESLGKSIALYIFNTKPGVHSLTRKDFL